MTAYRPGQDDFRMWMAALGGSLCLNLLAVAVLGFWVLDAVRLEPPVSDASTTSAPVATIYPQFEAPATEPVPPVLERQFVRTAADQPPADPTVNTRFIGERGTQATSDRAPDPNAPALPSQAGIDPRDRNDFETTESRFNDGPLEPAPSTPSTPTDPQPATAQDSAAMTDPTRPDQPVANEPPPLKERLFEGSTPVEIASVEPGEGDAEKPVGAPRTNPEEAPPTPEPDVSTAKAPEEAPPSPPKPPTPASDPAFSGFQRKTAIVGSISRTGRSALEVEDTPLGRYQAAISRAVELEWQRNCLRHRDFITPGFLTLRFFVEATGKVRQVEFIDDSETGAIQKGFTLNSVRDADIPPMPAALRREQNGEPLELQFRFYF